MILEMRLLLSAVFLVAAGLANAESYRALKVSHTEVGFSVEADCIMGLQGGITFDSKLKPTEKGLSKVFVPMTTAQVAAIQFSFGATRRASGVARASEEVRIEDSQGRVYLVAIKGSAKWSVAESKTQASIKIDFTPDSGEEHASHAADVTQSVPPTSVHMFAGISPYLKVIAAKMVGKSTLRVKISRRLQDEAKVRLVLHDSRPFAAKESAGVDIGAHYEKSSVYDEVDFDLKAMNVARFKQDFEGSVQVKLVSPIVYDTSEKRYLVIRLPVVFVPGIFNQTGGFPAVENGIAAIQKLDKAYFLKGGYDRHAGGLLGNPYATNPTYPGVVAASYITSSESFLSAARKLSTQVNSLITSTYADKVKLICHSKGGLVGRKYVQSIDKGLRTSLIIMIGTPHAGAPGAPLADYASPLLALPYQAYLLRLNELGADVRNLYPTSPSILKKPNTWIYAEPKNVELMNLNNQAWPEGTDHLMVFTKSAITIGSLVKVGDYYWPNDLTPGDGIVPAWSASGKSRNHATGKDWFIPCFDPLKGKMPPITVEVDLPGLLPHAGMLGATAVWDKMKFKLGIFDF